jgi:hypothetical protein
MPTVCAHLRNRHGPAARHGYLRDQREVEGVGVTFALVLEAVLVPPPVVATSLLRHTIARDLSRNKA